MKKNNTFWLSITSPKYKRGDTIVFSSGDTYKIIGIYRYNFWYRLLNLIGIRVKTKDCWKLKNM